MADELIRLDTTIIGIDKLIAKAPTAAEANVLFKLKDVIYSQQRYFADVQPVKCGRWIAENRDSRGYADCYTCTNCNCYSYTYTFMKGCEYEYCPKCGAKMSTE